MNKVKLIAFGLFGAVILFTGCAPKEVEVNSNMTKSIFINPVKKELRTVFVSTKNTSGKKINLDNSIRTELIAKGYKIIDDPEKATYVLMANVLYCDVKKHNLAGTGVVGGAVAGGVVSSAAGANNALPGVVIGGIAGGIIGSQIETVTFQMQVDIVIREKSQSAVSTSSAAAEGTSRRRLGNSRAEISSSEQSYTTNYIEHKTVMYSEAKKRGLTLEEARPVLETLISNQIVGLF